MNHMTATKAIQHIWNFDESADFSAIVSHQIILRNDGICFMSFDANKHIVAAKTVAFSSNLDEQTFRDLILDEPQLGGGEPLTHIWVLSDKNMLIPQELYDKEVAQRWFENIHFIAANDKMFSTPVAHPAMTVLETINETFLNCILEIYEDARITSWSQYAFGNVSSETCTVHLHLFGFKALVQIYRQNQLHAHQLIDADEATVIQYLSDFSEQYEVPQNEIVVVLNGYGDSAEVLSETLKTYFEVTIQRSAADTFNYIASCV